LAQSTTWSSHSPTGLDVPRSRASWPSAESSAKPTTSAAYTATPSAQDGRASATAAIPAKLHAALSAVTWFGVSPAR
jgi:hypothetical protein